MIETENHGMSLIRNHRGFLGALFFALLALGLFDPGAASAQEGKQIKLSDKHIQGFMAAYEDMAKLYDDANPEPDPKVEAQTSASPEAPSDQRATGRGEGKPRGSFIWLTI